MDFSLYPMNMDLAGIKYDYIICPGFPSYRWIPITSDPLGMLRKISNRLGDGSILLEDEHIVLISTSRLTIPTKRDLFNGNDEHALRLAWDDLTRA